MSRKVYVKITHKVILNCDDGCDVDSAINELEVDITSGWEGADVIDTEMSDYEITDSK